MKKTNIKEWYKSKTVWTAIITGVLGVIEALGLNIPNEVFVFLGSFGLYSLRTATKEIK
jgi:hypothetical protein